MSFTVRTPDGEDHVFDLRDIGENPAKKDVEKFIKENINVSSFDFDFHDLISDGDIIELSHACDTLEEAVKNDHVDCLDTFDITKYYKNNIIKIIFDNFSFGCLEYLQKKYYGWSSSTTLWAKKHGDLICPDKSCKWNKDSCNHSAAKGHLECLKFAYENGCEINDFMYMYISDTDNIECLKYLHEIGWEWDERATKYAISVDNLDFFIYMYENGCKIHDNLLKVSASGGKIDTLKYLYNLDYNFDKSDLIIDVVEGNNLECVKFLHDNGFDVSGYNWYGSKIINVATKNNNLELIKYLHHKKYRWDDKTTNAAAKYGNLDCLRYLHENGCEWDGDLLRIAKKYKNRDCFKYAITNGCKSYKKYTKYFLDKICHISSVMYPELYQ